MKKIKNTQDKISKCQWSLVLLSHIQCKDIQTKTEKERRFEGLERHSSAMDEAFKSEKALKETEKNLQEKVE